MPGRRALSALLLLVVLVCTVRAQNSEEPVLLGPVMGLEWGVQRGDVPVYSGSTECGVFTSGAASAAMGGVRLALPRLFGAWGLQGTAAWSSRSGRMNTLPVDQQFIRNAEDGALIELDRRYQLRTTLRGLRLDLLATIGLGERWMLSLGPSLMTLSTSEREQVDTILGPGRTSFADGQRSHPMWGGTELRSATLSLDALATLAYALPIGRRVTLVPEVEARVGLTSAVQGVPLRTLVLGGAIGILFDLSSPPSPPPPDTLPVVLPPPTPLLAASIDLRGVDAQGRESDRATVTVDEMLSRRYVPLLPMIFFEPNAATPASRYITASSEPVDNPDPMTMHLRMLQVIGERMRGEPSARITLFGSTAPGEASALARRRAEAVRDLLVRGWGIAPSRIAIGSGDGGVRRSSDLAEDGRAENRRVVISSSSSRILAPFIVESVERSFDPPAVVAHPAMRAEAGVRRWEVVLRQADVVVQRTSSDGEAEMQEMSWRIEAAEGDTTLTPISATLEVEDSTGARLTAHDEMPVSIRRRTRIVGGRGEERADSTLYTLVAFNYNDKEPGAEDKRFLEEIVATLGVGDQVSVIGFTDRIGGREYNAVLSRRRAERVRTLLRGMAAQRALEGIAVVVEGEGVDESRFANDLPEGRIFSRGVQVSVARPVELPR